MRAPLTWRVLPTTAMVVMSTVAGMAGPPLAQASQNRDPTVPSPGMEWFKGVGCMPTMCVGVGADDRGPLNGDPRSLVPINPMSGPGAPVTVNGFTEVDAIACLPSTASATGCLIVGALGALGGSSRAEYAWVGAHPSQGISGSAYPATGVSALYAASCAIQGTCVAVGTGGVVVVRNGHVAGAQVVTKAGLTATGVACATDSDCVLTDGQGIVTFDPATGTFGTGGKWAGGTAGGLACSTKVCEAVVSTYGPQPSATFARVGPATGSVGPTTLVHGVYVGALTCPTPTRCLAVGYTVKGAYPKQYQTPLVIPVLSGVPQAAVNVSAATGSDGLDAVDCAENAPALGPKDVVPAPCVAVGSSAAYSGPGVQTAGLVMPLSGIGKLRYFAHVPPSAALARSAIGEMVATDKAAAQFYPCTATVVASPRDDLVVTAAHCVESLADNHKYVSIYFAPGHTGPTCDDLNCGVNPEGVWTAQPSDVVVYSDTAHHQRYDWAFVHVHPAGSELPVGRVSGELDVEFNPSRHQSWTVYGYPHGALVSHGVYQLSFTQCSGTSTSADPSIVATPGPLGLFIGPPNCDRETAGASGGPWVDSQGRVGAVNKVQNAGMGIVGTYLGDDAAKAYAAVT